MPKTGDREKFREAPHGGHSQEPQSVSNPTHSPEELPASGSQSQGTDPRQRNTTPPPQPQAADTRAQEEIHHPGQIIELARTTLIQAGLEAGSWRTAAQTPAAEMQETQ